MTFKKTVQANEIGKRLRNVYAKAHVELNYSTPFELMVVSILAAQNTDVNRSA